MNDSIGIGFGKQNDDELYGNQEIKQEKLHGYSCPSCLNKFKSADTITNCPYCDSLVSGCDIDNITYDGIIPFSVSLDDAVNAYKKKVLFNPLLPFTFKSKKIIASIKPLYLSARICNTNISGDVLFLGGNKTSKNQKLSTIQKVELSYTSNFDYNNVYINTCSKIDDSFLNTVNDYNFSLVNGFNEDICGNTPIIIPDIDNNEVSDKLNKRTMNHALIIIRDNIQYGLKKLVENKMIITDKGGINICVPVYLLNIKYKDKNYIYLMNGQNGNSNLMVTIGILETCIFAFILFALIFLVGFLVTWLF